MATTNSSGGSGQFAVYDEDLTQYVSGVSDEATAKKAQTELGKDGITKGHKLVVREV